MENSKQRRILMVSSEDSIPQLARIIKDLTGSPELPDTANLAGSSHTLPLRTSYYSADVTIWTDTIKSAEEWSDAFLTDDAKVVLESLGALIVVFALPASFQSKEADAAKELITQVARVLSTGLGGWNWDGVSMCIGVGDVRHVDEWDDHCHDAGFEFLRVTTNRSQEAKNEFGERVGIPRVLEALEANEWDLVTSEDIPEGLEDILQEFGFSDGGGDSDLLNIKDMAFALDEESASARMLGEEKVSKDDEEEEIGPEDVEKLEATIAKLRAVREAGADMSEKERKTLAMKAIGEYMKYVDVQAERQKAKESTGA